jgi:peptidoglycan hydrolase CwlO-like protein
MHECIVSFVLQSGAMLQLIGLAQTPRETLSDREGFAVNLSSNLVEKDLHIERMGTQIHDLQEQVDERGTTIEDLESQLHDLKLELDDAMSTLICIIRSSKLL